MYTRNGMKGDRTAASRNGGVRLIQVPPKSRDAMRWVHIHNMFLSGTDFWRYLDKAYNSVPGSGGSNPLHAIPCVHGLTLTEQMSLCVVVRDHHELIKEFKV
jgi:hypothetical protein